MQGRVNVIRPVGPFFNFFMEIMEESFRLANLIKNVNHRKETFAAPRENQDCEGKIAL